MRIIKRELTDKKELAERIGNRKTIVMSAKIETPANRGQTHTPPRLNLVSTGGGQSRRRTPEPVCFTRQELSTILNVYGQFVAAGEWRDYAIDTTQDAAIFSVFRRASEAPLYRIEKRPRLARKQGAWLIQAANGGNLRRGHELNAVLRVFDKQRLRLAT